MAIKDESAGAATTPETAKTNGTAPAAEAKKTTTEAPAVKKPAESIGGFCVYIGPSIRGTIQRGTVYDMAKEQAVAKLAPAIAKYPLIEALIVPGSELAEARIKVKTKGNLLNFQYKKLAAGKSE